MVHCGVCFRCGETADGEPRYVAPDLLPGFEAVEGRLRAWRDGPGPATLRMEVRFLPPPVIRRVMAVLGWAVTMAEYWRYGLWLAWLTDTPVARQLLVRFEDTATERVPGAGALVLQAQGRDPLRHLGFIRLQTSGLGIGDPLEELLTLEGVTVSRAALATAVEGRVTATDGRMVAAGPYSAFSPASTPKFAMGARTRMNETERPVQRRRCPGGGTSCGHGMRHGRPE